VPTRLPVTGVTSRQHLRSATPQLLIVPRHRLSIWPTGFSVQLVRRSGIPCRTTYGIRLLAGTVSVSEDVSVRNVLMHPEHYRFHDDALYKSTFYLLTYWDSLVTICFYLSIKTDARNFAVRQLIKHVYYNSYQLLLIFISTPHCRQLRSVNSFYRVNDNGNSCPVRHSLTLKSVTATRISSAIAASSSAWLGFRIGTPLAHVYASPIVSTFTAVFSTK